MKKEKKTSSSGSQSQSQSQSQSPKKKKKQEDEEDVWEWLVVSVTKYVLCTLLIIKRKKNIFDKKMLENVRLHQKEGVCHCAPNILMRSYRVSQPKNVSIDEHSKGNSFFMTNLPAL